MSNPPPPSIARSLDRLPDIIRRQCPRGHCILPAQIIHLAPKFRSHVSNIHRKVRVLIRLRQGQAITPSILQSSLLDVLTLTYNSLSHRLCNGLPGDTLTLKSPRSNKEFTCLINTWVHGSNHFHGSTSNRSRSKLLNIVGLRLHIKRRRRNILEPCTRILCPLNPPILHIDHGSIRARRSFNHRRIVR